MPGSEAHQDGARGSIYSRAGRWGKAPERAYPQVNSAMAESIMAPMDEATNSARTSLVFHFIGFSFVPYGTNVVGGTRRCLRLMCSLRWQRGLRASHPEHRGWRAPQQGFLGWCAAPSDRSVRATQRDTRFLTSAQGLDGLEGPTWPKY